MKKQRGSTLSELMTVVTIIGILSVLALPMYMDNVSKTNVQEAVGTIGAIKDEIGTYVSENGFLPPRWNNHGQIRGTIGVQVPANGKWRYRVINNGVIYARALAPLGRTLRGVDTMYPLSQLGQSGDHHRQWRSDGRTVNQKYLTQ